MRSGARPAVAVITAVAMGRGSGGGGGGGAGRSPRRRPGGGPARTDPTGASRRAAAAPRVRELGKTAGERGTPWFLTGKKYIRSLLIFWVALLRVWGGGRSSLPFAILTTDLTLNSENLRGIARWQRRAPDAGGVGGARARERRAGNGLGTERQC